MKEIKKIQNSTGKRFETVIFYLFFFFVKLRSSSDLEFFHTTFGRTSHRQRNENFKMLKKDGKNFAGICKIFLKKLKSDML